MYPPALVDELRVIVPVNSPSALIEPDPLNVVPPAPVVGAVPFWGLKRILQSSQVLANPPPVTAISAPRIPPVVGVNLTNDVKSVMDEAVTAVVSVDDFTVNVPVPLVIED
jgi:hypothetical protein